MHKVDILAAGCLTEVPPKAELNQKLHELLLVVEEYRELKKASLKAVKHL
jgi:hypothetical protein